MAILATDLDRISHFAMNKAIAMAILRKMAIHALHADLGMNG